MEAWKTYTPDGRVLEVTYSDGEWTATCTGAGGSAANARDAIAAALGSQVTSIRTNAPALAAWIATHAAQLEAEAG